MKKSTNTPNLKTLSLQQYIKTQNTELDPFYTQSCEKKEQIEEEYEIVKENSSEYKNYIKAEEALEQAQKEFDEAAENYFSFLDQLENKNEAELNEVEKVAAEQRKKMLELADPNHEKFTQCVECHKIIQKNNLLNCWKKECDTNQKYCENCTGYTEWYEKRKCQYCFLPACCNDHHYEHVKACAKYYEKNICGFDPGFGEGSEDVGFFDYREWSEENWKNKPEDWYILFEGRIDRENYFCNKITPNVQTCRYCGHTYCPDCHYAYGFCKLKSCAKESENPWHDEDEEDW